MRRSIPSLLGAAVCAAACAGPIAGIRDGRSPTASGTERGWQALVDGRNAAAARELRHRLAEDPADVLALFGQASLAFEQGRGDAALASYVSLLERAAAAPDAWGRRLAPMAAGRASTLLREHGGTEAVRRGVEDRLAAIPTAELPWEARYELAMVADAVGRRRGDPAAMARAARAAGCVRGFSLLRPAGSLPHLDLDRDPAGAAAAAAETPWRTVTASGCRVSLPSFEQRPGPQRVAAEIEVSGAGTFDLVLDYFGEARLILDGRPSFAHGNEHRYGPRVSAARVMLEPGRHRLEVRFAAFGGDAELSVMVVPASEGRGARRGAEARAAPEGPPPPLPGGAPVPSPVVTETPSPGPAALVAAGALARAYVADRHGAAERAWRAAVELEGYGRFAIGLALAATLARDDPGRPGGLARDRARPLVRAALAIDPTLARVRHALAVIALEDERPREALDEAAAAAEAAPGWWIPELTLHAAFRLRGLGWDADRALDRASRLGPGACPVLAAALSRAEDRREAAAEARLHAALSACGPDADERVAWLRRRGDLPGAEAALRLALALRPDRAGTKLDLAEVLVAQDRAAEAAVLLAATVDARDGDGQIRLADAQASAGDRTGARATIAAALRTRPDLPEVRRAARALGLPLPLDPFRVDGRQVIRAFEAAGRTYAAPAVVVLDRTVTRVFPDGAEMTLTHNIVRVQSKDGIDKWGEVEVPDGAEILALRTHKRDGSTREPEEFAGKDAVSAVDLAIGDYVEWETLETDPPRDGLGDPAAGGGPTFMGERFYFQSFDAPLDRSEYLVVTTAEAADRLRVDARAGAPAPTRSSGVEGTVVTTFAASGVAQLFPERSSVAAVDHIPSVRVSSGVTWASWSRFLREQLYGTTRSAPVLRDVAAALRARAGGAASPAALAAAATAWVAQNVEPDSDLRDPASFAAARGRGNRVAVLLALGQELGLPVRPVLARSRLVAEATAPTPTEEADDFAEPLVAFDVAPGEAAYVYPPLKHAPFGYLPPGLDGARILELGSGAFRIARGRVDDHRAVDLAIRLDGQGGGAAEAVEALRGWPALEWAELVDRWGGDRTRLRQDFEQRWLGIHFPGAVLKELEVEILGPDGKRTLPRVTGAALPLAYTASEVKLRYSFTSSRLALRRDREMRLLPTFFRSQPGRRFATEPQRRTALLLGSDIPLGLRVRVELPPAARIVEPPRDARGVVVGKLGGYRFTEERRLERRADGGPVLVLERESALPIMRVAPSEYPAVADELRRVDALEQQEIRIGLPPGGAP